MKPIPLRALPFDHTNRRRLVVVAFALLVAVSIVGGVYAQHRAAGGPGRPNVILILADDMRYDSLQVMDTVNQLGRQGVAFESAYVTTPLCCPSRASIMTGLYARHHGVLTNQPPIGGVTQFDDSSTLATWLQAADVRTGLVGRYLNGYESTDVAPGWDTWFGIWQSGEGYSNYYRYRATENGTMRYFASTPDDYSTRVVGQKALEFLAADRQRPFFLMVTPRTPHGPATPDPLDSGTFKGVDLPVAPSFDEQDVSDKPGFVKSRKPLSRKEQEELSELRRLQNESLLSLDRMIGSLVEALRADGRLENTWIIFTADNGLTLGEHRLGEGKMCPYEECIRAPLVVIPPPGQIAPRVDHHLVANIDLAPTIAELMGAEPDRPVDGRSLVPLLSDEQVPWRDALIIEQWFDEPEPMFVGIRTADRKYVDYKGADEELYDESADPYELESLHMHPERAAEKQQLADRLAGLLAEPSVSPAARRAP